MDRTVVRMVPMSEQREAYALNLSIDDRLRVLESLNAQGRRMLGVPSSARLRREVVVRTRFPKNSPPPQSHLKGVEPDRLLAEGELLEGRFRAVATPGHDDDCLTWIDTRTNTAFTGDSLQANGTICQGVGFYRSLPAYRGTLATLRAQGLENLVCGHDYDGIGDVVRGKEAVACALAACADRVALYDERIRSYVAAASCGASRPAYVAGASRPGPSEDEDLLVELALRLIDEVGCGRPAALFLALHTVSEHLKEIMVGRDVPSRRNGRG